MTMTVTPQDLSIQVQLGQREASTPESSEPRVTEISTGRRTMSPAAKRKIRAAQKARWAAYHEQKEKEAREAEKAVKVAARPKAKRQYKRRKPMATAEATTA